MKITVRERRTTEAVVDVELPIYRKHEAGDEHEWTYYAKVYATPAGLRELTLRRSCRHCPGLSWEVEDSAFASHDDADFALGRGQFALTAAEWAAALAEFRAWLAKKLADSGEASA